MVFFHCHYGNENEERTNQCVFCILMSFWNVQGVVNWAMRGFLVLGAGTKDQQYKDYWGLVSYTVDCWPFCYWQHPEESPDPHFISDHVDRSFSSLHHIKKFLRSSMTCQHLKNLFLLYIHIAQTESLDPVSVAKEVVPANTCWLD